MSFEELYDELEIIEEQIEGCYLSMSEAEHTFNNDNYVYYFELLKSSINEEKRLITKLALNKDYLKNLELKVKSETKNTPKFKCILGKDTGALFYRIKYILETLSGDEVLDYINTLRYDRNKIILRLLEDLINNPEYESIKEELVLYKYNFYFLNMYNEEDFLKGNNDNLALAAQNFRTIALPCSTYLDQSVLFFPSGDAINLLYDEDNDLYEDGKTLKSDSEAFFRVVIDILNIMGSIILCEEEYAESIFECIDEILTDQEFNYEIKAIMKDIIAILDNIRKDISWGRKHPEY